MRKLTPSILIVDDDTILCNVIAYSLTLAGFNTIIAHNGVDCLALAEHRLPDLLLLDLFMPDMNGFAVCKQMKSNPATAAIGIIFLTVSDVLSEKLEGFRLGAIDFFTKPIEPKELVARVAIHLQQRAQLDSVKNRLDIYQRRFGHPSAETEPTLPAKLQVSKIQQARQVIEQRINNPPNLEELASIVHLSPRRLTHEFRAIYGMTPSIWLREYRMLQAAELLRTTSLPISLIGENIGIPNAAAFSTQFKQRFSITPREYRDKT